MNETDEIENNVFRNSIQFLGTVSRFHIPPVLKSVFSLKQLLLENRLQHAPAQPQRIIGGQCSKCFINLLDGPAAYCIDPGKKKSKFDKKLLKKAKKNKPMTEYQKKRHSQLKNPLCNEVVIKCKFCKKIYRKILHKPARKKPVVQVQSNIEKKKKPKKKKKKDLYCGLNQSAVDLTKNLKKNKQKPETNIVIDLTSPKTKSGKVINKVTNPKIHKVTEGKITKSVLNKEKRKKTKNKNTLNKLNSLLNNETPKKDRGVGLKHFLANL